MLKTLRNIAQRVFNPDTNHGDVIRVGTGPNQDGFFKAVTRAASAGTSIVVEPLSSDDSIQLTDLLFTTDKVNGTTATLRFTDGTDTINVIAADLTDAPCNIGTTFGGKWQGWAGARLELVTVGVVTATAACGYIRVDRDHTYQAFDTWDAARG